MAKKSSKKTKSQKRTPSNSPKKASSTNRGLPNWWPALAVFAFAFLLYANTIEHGYVLDDDLVCNKNRYVQEGFSGLGDIFTHSWYYGFASTPDRYYRPMMLAGFAVENAVLGNEPSTYHLMNVFFFGAFFCRIVFACFIFQS